MEKGLLEKTGKTLEHWIKVVTDSGIEKHREIINFLKKEHGFTHGYANFVSLRARQSDAGSIDDADLLTMQYKGKEDLKPVYETLVSAISKFGNDIQFVPKKSSVSCIRKRQFALIKPATKTRIDLGLKFNDRPVDGRLEGSGPFGTMCTHRIRLESEADVDKQLIDWIREAYDEAG